MASLASSEGSISAPYDGTKNAHKDTQKNTSTPTRSPKKPRTRSAVLKASQQRDSFPGTPRKRKKSSKKHRSRSASPVIDLTLEDGGIEEQSGDDSPLKRVVRKQKAKIVAENSPKGPESSGTDYRTSSVVPESKRVPEHVDVTVPSASAFSPPKDQENMGTSPLLEADSAKLPPQINSASTTDLNSSPIKKPETHTLLPAPKSQKLSSFQFSSSPSKRVKSVAFSDTIEQDGPSSPLSNAATTPRKSILKSTPVLPDSSPVDPNNSSMWVKTTHSLQHASPTKEGNHPNHSPSNPLFWQPGTIIQLEPKSSDLPQLVDGCMEVLKDENFDKKFEVYATLNLVCRTNDVSTATDLFSGENSTWLSSVEKYTGYKPKSTPAYIKSMVRYAKRDMEMIEAKLCVKNEPTLSGVRNNPFESRALTQALKLMAYFLAVPALNSSIPVPEVKWFYNHACEMIVKPTLSKSLVSPFLSILKDCHFPSKKRKLIFESNANALSEKMLFAILNMKNYLSSSLINEKFIALRNLIQNFSAISAKHFHHWYPGLLVNLCDLSFVLYSKVVGTGITTLLEAARNYLDNNDICLYTRKFIESPLPTSQKSWVMESSGSSRGEQQQLALDYVVESLYGLLDGGFYKHAMDIWVGVTLLLGKYDDGIDNWKHIGTWLQVQRTCFSADSLLAKETALASWKVIVYKVCCYDLKDSRLFFSTPLESPGKSLLGPMAKQNNPDDILRSKIRLLIHPFTYVTNADIRRELVDGFHNCFLSILYNLLSHQPKLNAKYLSMVWDRIIQHILLNFYFKKDSSNAQMHQLGLATVMRLLKPSAPMTEKAFIGIRCLSHEPIVLSEINPLNPRWVYLRFDKVLPIMSLIFKSRFLSFEERSESLLCFLDSIKVVTKKDVQVSDTTFDLIDNLPLCLEALLNESPISYAYLNRVVLSLNDTFGAANLVSMTEDTKSVVDPVMFYALRSLTNGEALSLLEMWCSAIGEKKNLKFLSILDHVNREIHRSDVTGFIAECLNNKKVSKFSFQELIMVGKMFQVISHDFNSIAKKIIQQIVLLKTEEFEMMITRLGIVEWNTNIFIFFVVLMHDAPYDHLKSATVNLIGERARNDDFKDIVEALLTHRFHFEISHLAKVIVETVRKEVSAETPLACAWADYIKNFDSDFSTLDELLVCAFQAGLDVKHFVATKLDELPRLKSALSEVEACSSADLSLQINGKNKDNEKMENHHVSSNESISESSVHSSLDSSKVQDSSLVEAEAKAKTMITGQWLQDGESICIEVSSDDRDENGTYKGEGTHESERKRKNPEQESREYKRIRSDDDPHFPENDSKTTSADIKQVSDSEESCREKENRGNEGVEVMSSSEEKQRSNMEITPAQVVFQGQSTANNSDESSDVLVISRMKNKLCGSTALATVEEKPPTLQLSTKSKATALHEVFAQFDDADLANLAENERYDLETGMMQFMLRMRRAKMNQTESGG